MISLPLDELRGLGRLDGDGDATGLTIDSRTAGPGDLFVAVRGGRAFVDAARAQGAATLVPDDEHAALAAIGRALRARSRARVVGITGSTGKTSTKDILAALCAPVARTVATRASENAELGVPLTLGRLEPDTELCLVELGMRGAGQIAELCEIARPGLGVITAIGPVHLELVGSVDGVARSKAELVTALPPGGVAVVPRSPELEPYLERDDIDVRRVGEVDVELREDGAHVAFEGGRIRFPLRSRHQAQNALTALTAYHALGLPLDRLQEAADTVELSRWRGEELELPGGGVAINDAYNANPTSMRAALEQLAGPPSRAQARRPRRHGRAGRARRALSPRAWRAGARARDRGRRGRRARPRLRLRHLGSRRDGGRRGDARAASPRRRRARQGLACARARRGRSGPGERGRLMVRVLIAGLIAMVVSIVIGPKFIEFMRRNELGQPIREDGPAGHVVKQGTPVMGGLLIMLCAFLPFFALSRYTLPALTVLFVTVGCGAIGFLDDFIKLRHRRSLGLKGRWKLLLLLAITVVVGFALQEEGRVGTSIYLPIVDVDLPLSYLFYPFLFFVIAGAANGVNLTDGVDGLAAGTAIISLFTFLSISVIAYIRSAPASGERTDYLLDLSILAAALIGGAIGFLWYNSFPAEVFMGDTGSMALGGALAGFAIVTGTEALLLLIGGIYVIVALSVIIQVLSFKYRGKRVFLIAPLQHHFEMKAWSETKIMVRFWIVAAILCTSGFVLYYRYYLQFRL